MNAVSKALTALAIALTASVVACQGDSASSPRIKDYDDGTGGGLANADTKGNVPYAFDDATLCLTAPGKVVVEKVQISRPTGGIRVTSFSLRRTRQESTFNYVSDPRQRLAEVGYPQKGPMIVDRVCAKDPTSDPAPGEGSNLLGVEVSKPTDATAIGNGFIVTYRSGDDSHEMYVPLGILLCKGKTDSPDCKGGTDLRRPDGK